ncbi:hypothetical protein D3H65_09725 [Paraflavitalea soli]|uniref:Glycoside hydrolase family 88 protein n=1 Tax=Paraflavitalea soli TaxID=2315862 RepID=A0A3B7MRJ8_9BACT|nr:glycoside hydrolase family 88 protein [Paraflavitalea soli]AXY74235.1 hypothetical protein D3H65_09725 [Paraflavitalea soli]
MKHRIPYLYRLIALMLLPLLAGGGRVHAQASPAALTLARQVADRFIADTRFDLVFEPQEEVLGMQVVNFSHLALQAGQRGYALRYSQSGADTLVRFGISSAASLQIWLNDVLVFEQPSGLSTNPKEVAYGKFRFSRYFTARQQKGSNKWLILLDGANQIAPVVLLRPQTAADDLDGAVAFNSPETGGTWLFAGGFAAGSSSSLPGSIQFPYLTGTDLYSWQKAPQRLLPTLRIDSTAAYQRESYANWHYSHGIAVWSILQLAGATEQTGYNGFVKKYTDFVLNSSPYFNYQYEQQHAWRGTLHRLFRRTMLDDTGAPILPFAALYTTTDNAGLKALVDTIAQVVRTQQTRLADGTFCRPEPVAYTVWADDLFMSVPFLSIMAKATGNAGFFDEASKQVLQFQQYLFNPATGLYKHGWFSTSREQAVAYWGRANGWIAWATAELLNVLPRQHAAYQKILTAFRQHMAALVKCQLANGMWPQLLNRPDSYAETSCTAMFTLAIARGVSKGWLPSAYKKYALLGWQGVARNIEENGLVHGICRGTEIGFDEQFYLDRKQLDNDPRGLGAVITAGIEISKLDQSTKK